MTEEIVNLNLDDWICVSFKMVSGEEIIAHVDKDMLMDTEENSLVLHDPFMIALNHGLVVMTVWVISNQQDEHVISKNDIMLSGRADEKFEDLYLQLLEKKYASENLKGKSYGKALIWDGGETIH